MDLNKVLVENRLVIAEKWLDAVLSTYHKDGARFFKKQQDRFANPLGYSARTGLEKMVKVIAEGGELEVSAELKQFIKLRAVQEFTPAKALAFIYDLKPIMLEVCAKETEQMDLNRWFQVESQIDSLALLVFDLYMAARELIHKVKYEELRSGNAGVVAGGCPSGAVIHKHNAEKMELKVLRDC
ncbi:hypothetical protein MNBD_DELTA03-397 [hydrothermal vent metagenome]|uniref:RsbT co-antagonist protein RsbRD N-terminal domain-containing protein n=1 Tax=hydrothermal vent metagenome TaxID=652676 RepID=A0A3B0UXN3_9ZZZZ